MNVQRHRWPAGVAKALVLLLALCALTAVRAATPDVPETWSITGDLRGWRASSSVVTLSNPDERMQMAFRNLTGPPSPESAIAIADALASDGMFVGNYAADGITNVSFRFLAWNSRASAVRVYISCATNGNEWYVPLPPPPAGKTTSYSMPLDYSAGWTIGPEKTEAQFLADIQDIAWVGVYVRRGGSPRAQYYAIDDFILGAATEDSSGTQEDRHLDSDGDGMSNWAEMHAGTDPNDPRSVLWVRPVPKGAGVPGLRIGWNSITNRYYTVWRSTNLFDGFKLHRSGLRGEWRETLFDDDEATNNGVYFYMIEAEP